MMKLEGTSPYFILILPQTFILLTSFLSFSSHNPHTILLPKNTITSPSNRTSSSAATISRGDIEPRECDIFSGDWVPDPAGPYYTNETCSVIHEYQNCMKYGRPDSGFAKWRWKPEGCELPLLDPARFLTLMRGKSMAFVGDSVARNQMQSLICLLSRVRPQV